MILKKGAKGAEVQDLQKFLMNQGFDPGVFDGVFGPRTEAALKQFQTKNGLTVDGIAGPKTLGVVNTIRSTPPQEPQKPGTSETPGDSTGNAYFDELFKRFGEYLNELEARGNAINQNVIITPEKAAEFMAQAEREFDPYYRNQAGQAREGFLRSLGYSQNELSSFEQDMERKYGKALRTIGDQAAESGFALSGRRIQDEQNLAQDTQQTLDTNRRKLEFDAGTRARDFAGQYGLSALPNLTLDSAPTVAAGSMSFQRSGASKPLYELSNDLYDQLKGSKTFEQEAAKRTRASELEEAFRSQSSLNQSRSLNLGQNQ